MRVMLFFDLPTISSSDLREYRRFRKLLIKNGYIMLQESVYCKLTANYGACELEIEKLRKNKPKDGNVQCLMITEKQFPSIEYICGEKTNTEIDSTDRFISLW